MNKEKSEEIHQIFFDEANPFKYKSLQVMIDNQSILRTGVLVDSLKKEGGLSEILRTLANVLDNTEYREILKDSDFIKKEI